MIDKRCLVVRELALDIGKGDDVRTGGRPVHGYGLLADPRIFRDFDEASAFIKEEKLPVGWVVVSIERLIPGIATQKTEALPFAEFSRIRPGEDPEDWHKRRRGQASALVNPFLRASHGTEHVSFSVDPKQAEVIAEALLFYARKS